MANLNIGKLGKAGKKKKKNQGLTDIAGTGNEGLSMAKLIPWTTNTLAEHKCIFPICFLGQ